MITNLIDDHNSKVTNEKKILYPVELNHIFFFSFYSMIISLWVPLILGIAIDYRLSKTHAYFRIGLDEENLLKKINQYQNGIESYNNFLGEEFGIRLRHLEEIESHLLSEKTEKMDEEIKSSLDEFDEPLQLARRLDSWTYTSEPKILNITNMNEIFKTNRPYENLQKWSKIINVSIPTSIGLILFWVTKTSIP